MKNLIAGALVATMAVGTATLLNAQSKPATPQKIDAEYTAKIKESLQDARISTELVDHLPASDTVPSPLKFLGRYVGQPGELTYAKDIHRYYEQLAKVSPRARYWRLAPPKRAATSSPWRSPTRRRSSRSKSIAINWRR